MAPNQGINDVNPVAAEIDGNNSLVYGVFNDVDIRSEARHDELTTTFTQVSLEGKHTFSDAFNMHAMVGFAEANHDNPVQTTLLFDAFDVDGYSYDYRDNSRLPLITYGAADVTSPSTWALTQIRLRPQSTINSYQTAQLDFEWAASDSFKLKFGPQWKNYIFKSTELRRSNGTPANQENIIPVVAPISSYSTLTHFGNGLGLPSGSVTSWLSPDLIAAVDALDLNNPSIYRMGIEAVLGNNNEVEEDDLGAFVQGDFNFELGAHTLRGNLGVRYVKTDMTSQGYVLVSNVPTIQEATHDYSDTLPSLNLVYDLSESLLLRFGAAKVMTRPNLGQVTPGAAVSVSGANRTVSVGNPTLDPFRATSYDFGIEWYFAPESLLSLALFYKDVDSFVQTLRDQRPFADNPYGLDDSVGVAACGTTPGCSIDARLGLHHSCDYARRPGQRLRNQLPAAVQLPARLLEQLRRDPQLHRRRIGDHLYDGVGPGGADANHHQRDQRPHGSLEERLQRHAVFRQQGFQRARGCGLSVGLPDDGAGTQRQRRRRHGVDAEHRLLVLVQHQ